MTEPLTPQEIDFTLSQDLLLRDIRTDLFSVMIPVLGIPVRFETNSRAVHAIIERTFAAWRKLEGVPQVISERTARVRVMVHEGNEGTADARPRPRHLQDPRQFGPDGPPPP
jgi:hypothetical protein